MSLGSVSSFAVCGKWFPFVQLWFSRHASVLASDFTCEGRHPARLCGTMRRLVCVQCTEPADKAHTQKHKLRSPHGKVSAQGNCSAYGAHKKSHNSMGPTYSPQDNAGLVGEGWAGATGRGAQVAEWWRAEAAVAMAELVAILASPARRRLRSWPGRPVPSRRRRGSRSRDPRRSA